MRRTSVTLNSHDPMYAQAVRDWAACFQEYDKAVEASITEALLTPGGINEGARIEIEPKQARP